MARLDSPSCQATAIIVLDYNIIGELLHYTLRLTQVSPHIDDMVRLDSPSCQATAIIVLDYNINGELLHYPQIYSGVSNSYTDLIGDSRRLDSPSSQLLSPNEIEDLCNQWLCISHYYQPN